MLGDLANSRQEQRGSERHRHAGPLHRRPQPVEAPVGHPFPLVPLVKIKAQADHARTLFPVRDQVAAFRVVEIEPPHDGKAVGYFRTASCASSFESGSHSTGWISARSTPA